MEYLKNAVFLPFTVSIGRVYIPDSSKVHFTDSGPFSHAHRYLEGKQTQDVDLSSRKKQIGFASQAALKDNTAVNPHKSVMETEAHIQSPFGNGECTG